MYNNLMVCFSKHHRHITANSSFTSKKTLLISAYLLCLIGVSASIFSINSQSSKVEASGEETRIFPGEKPLDTSSLSVSAIASTTTDYGTSYELKFSTGSTAIIDNSSAYNVTGYDDSLTSYVEEVKAMSADERTALRAKIAAGEEYTQVFDGYIYSLENAKQEVVLPRTLSRGDYGYDAIYTVKITSLNHAVCGSGSKLTTISIPSDITNIPSDAFSNATNLETIYCEASSAPEGYEEGWSGNAEVVWGYNIYQDDTSGSLENANTIQTSEVGDENVNYIIGYFPKSGTSYPLTIEYKVVGSSEARYVELEKTTLNQEYDGVGKKISGFSNTLTVDIDTKKGEEIDFDSIVVHNIFLAEEKVVEEAKTYVPVFSEKFYTSPAKFFTRSYDINEFINIHYQKTTTFAGYTTVNSSVDQVNAGKIYQTLKPTLYKNYQSQINSGAAYIRYRITSLTSTYYRVKTTGGEISQKVSTPVTQTILTNKTNNNVSFVLENSAFGSSFNANNLTTFGLSNMTVTLDIVLNDTILSRTSASTTFGTVYFLNENTQSKVFDANLLVILVASVYTVLAAILITVLLFTLKKKYRNDEFRRIKPKSFVLKGILYWATSLVLVLDILFIVLRSTLFNNAIVVYNPVDIFIVIFSIAGIIIIGYFLKTFVTLAKANSQRRKAKKLGMDKDVVEDGTK